MCVGFTSFGKKPMTCFWRTCRHVYVHGFARAHRYTPINFARSCEGSRKVLWVTIDGTWSTHMYARKPASYITLSASHTYTTHGPRTEKLAILASALSFARCASAFVTRSSSALDQRYAFVVIRCVRRDFCACTKNVRGARTHECIRQKDTRHSQSALDQRQTRAERAGPTPDTRGAHAGYSLYVRRLRSSEHLAHT